MLLDGRGARDIPDSKPDGTSQHTDLGDGRYSYGYFMSAGVRVAELHVLTHVGPLNHKRHIHDKHDQGHAEREAHYHLESVHHLVVVHAGRARESETQQLQRRARQEHVERRYVALADELAGQGGSEGRAQQQGQQVDACLEGCAPADGLEALRQVDQDRHEGWTCEKADSGGIDAVSLEQRRWMTGGDLQRHSDKFPILHQPKRENGLLHKSLVCHDLLPYHKDNEKDAANDQCGEHCGAAPRVSGPCLLEAEDEEDRRR